MITITNKLRTIVAVGVAGAALACSSVASAAIVAPKPGTGTPVVASKPTIVAKYIDPGKVGSAGIAGYSQDYCQTLAGRADFFYGVATGAAMNGDARTAASATKGSNELSNEVEDNCLVVD